MLRPRVEGSLSVQVMVQGHAYKPLPWPIASGDRPIFHGPGSPGLVIKFSSDVNLPSICNAAVHPLAIAPCRLSCWQLKPKPQL